MILWVPPTSLHVASGGKVTGNRDPKSSQARYEVAEYPREASDLPGSPILLTVPPTPHHGDRSAHPMRVLKGFPKILQGKSLAWHLWYRERCGSVRLGGCRRAGWCILQTWNVMRKKLLNHPDLEQVCWRRSPSSPAWTPSGAPQTHIKPGSGSPSLSWERL